MEEEIGVMSPEREDAEAQTGKENPFSPEEIQQIQEVIDQNPMVGQFIDFIAAEDPAEYGIIISPPTVEGGEPPMMPPMGGMPPGAPPMM